MKDEKAPSTGGFGPDYVGWSVPVIATAYVMANSYEEARFKVEAGLRKQQRVMLTKLDTLQPVQVSEPPDAIENIPAEPGPVQAHVVEPKQEPVLTEVQKPRPTAHVPPCTFCDVHKRDITKSRTPCTPGQECHAAYWRTAMKGAK